MLKSGVFVVPLLFGPLVYSTCCQAHDREVAVGDATRMTQQSFIASAKGMIADPQIVYGATGVITCGDIRATGQLTVRGDEVTSAAHTFFDEAGNPRSAHGNCQFSVNVRGVVQSARILPGARMASGSTNPYATGGNRDWAVARLEHPIEGVRPYGIAETPAVGSTILVVAAGADGERTYGFCRVRELVGVPGKPREIHTDCTCADGMSGAAYLTPGPHPRLIGVHVGFRSRDPNSRLPYSETHYTFGTSSEGAFRRAIGF
ncbi:MAG: hypothetical protein P4L82_13435 [Ancalomicrobiaceae bacterium]|nr:hypothetical protein [Ancalomicrobiaceae bacterium]